MAMMRDAQAEFILSRLEGYFRECEDARMAVSQEVFGNRGAYIGTEAPTREGRLAVIEQALADIEDLT